MLTCERDMNSTMVIGVGIQMMSAFKSTPSMGATLSSMEVCSPQPTLISPKNASLNANVMPDNTA